MNSSFTMKWQYNALENLAYNVILGIDFLSSNKAKICFVNNTLSIQDNFLDVPLNNVENVEHFEYVKVNWFNRNSFTFRNEYTC